MLQFGLKFASLRYVATVISFGQLPNLFVCLFFIWEKEESEMLLLLLNYKQILATAHTVVKKITKKEPKSDNCLSKFDWYDLSPVLF